MAYRDPDVAIYRVFFYQILEQCRRTNKILQLDPSQAADAGSFDS